MIDKSNNELFILGTGILILGLVLGSYSFTSYMEIKDLESKINFELIDENNYLSASEKYYRYVEISDYLNQKLNKNKNLPIKNSTCIYLDYAQHNAIELFRLTNKKLDTDENKKIIASSNIRSLFNKIDDYGTCKNAPIYKSELHKLLTEIEQDQKAQENEERMARFLNGYNYKKENKNTITEELPKLDPIPKEEVIKDIQNIKQKELLKEPTQ